MIESTYAGDHVRLLINSQQQRIHAHVAPQNAPRAGEEVGVTIPAERLWRLPSSPLSVYAPDDR